MLKVEAIKEEIKNSNDCDSNGNYVEDIGCFLARIMTNKLTIYKSSDF